MPLMTLRNSAYINTYMVIMRAENFVYTLI